MKHLTMNLSILFQADLDSLPENEYHQSFFFPEGILFSFAPNPISDEAAKVLTRFAGVFGQTYRRYLDLQNAEAQAREAIKQSSLDRVRGKIASMRSPEDLQDITPLIWSELETLGSPFYSLRRFYYRRKNFKCTGLFNKARWQSSWGAEFII